MRRVRGRLCHHIEAAAEANRLADRYERAHQLLDLAQKTYESSGETVFAGRLGRSRGMVYLGNNSAAEVRQVIERWFAEKIRV